MKKLILLFAALFLIIQLSVGQMSRQPEFSTWVKTESVANVSYKSDNVVHDSYVGQVSLTRKQELVPWKITLVAVSATVLEAVGDAAYDIGKTDGNQNQMMMGKAFQGVSLASHFLYIPIMKDSNTNWLWVPVVEACWRFILFDMVYNLTRGLNIGYIGNTTYWDKGLQTFAAPTGMRLFADGVAATFVISFTFDKFK